MKSNEIKGKVASTNLEKYGFDNPMKSNEIKGKVVSTNLEKYGFKSYTQTKEYKEKSKKANLDKWGSEFFMKSDTYRIGKFKISSDPNYIRYLNDGKSLFRCENGHDFEIHSQNYHTRKENKINLCTICNPIGDSQSLKEKELYEYIRLIYTGEIIQSYRDVLEIDIYLPNLKLGFEFNGLYWHSNKFRYKNYHLDKLNHFKERGIRIIYIWEDDYLFKNDIIKSQIKNHLNLSNRIWARKCYVKEIDNKISRDFLDKNHIQGSYKQIIKSFGLYYNEELVSVITFDHFEGRKRMNNDEWNLSRFCNKSGISVIGGASKLLNFFIKEFLPIRIISYANKDWSEGALYDRLKFTKLYETKPDYKYIIGYKRYHKSNFKKNERLYKDYIKIYDCGKIKFEKII